MNPVSSEEEIGPEDSCLVAFVLPAVVGTRMGLREPSSVQYPGP